MGVRVGRIDGVEHDDLLALVTGFGDQLLGLVETSLPVRAAAPASLAIGVQQVKKDGQSFQFCGSPAKAVMKSA
jgi:hypothetical protein